MNTTIVNTEANKAKIEYFTPKYDFSHTAKETINELIAAVNYLLERDRSVSDR